MTGLRKLKPFPKSHDQQKARLKFKCWSVWLKIHTCPLHHIVLSFLSKWPASMLSCNQGWLPYREFLLPKLWILVRKSNCEGSVWEAKRSTMKPWGVCILTGVKCQECQEITGGHLPDTQVGSHPQPVGKPVTHRGQTEFHLDSRSRCITGVLCLVTEAALLFTHGS